MLATLQVLSEQTDSASGITAGKLRDGISKKASSLADRNVQKPNKRTLWRDIETLTRAGFDIAKPRGTRGTYALISNFEPWELRFLADTVRTSRSLTKKQGERIIEKLKSVAPLSSRKILNRRLEVQQQFHSGTFEQTAYALDAIEKAIDNGWQLSYIHEKRNANGDRVVRKQSGTGSERRIVSPIEYVYSAEGYYYLIVFDPKARSKTKTPRIDRMRDVQAMPGTKAVQVPRKEIGRILKLYRQSFGMFEAKPTKVQLRAKAEHVKSIIDRFGEDIRIDAISQTESLATIRVSLSRVFYSWVAQFAGEITIEAPVEATAEMRAFLRKNMDAYE